MPPDIKRKVFRYLQLLAMSVMVTVVVDECINGQTVRSFVERHFKLAKPTPVITSVSKPPLYKFTDSELHFDGIRHPNLKPSCDVDLPDDTVVIGVVVESQPRAYLVDAMSSPSTHVVNDLVGTCPVTVTYCNLVGHARVLTKSEHLEPLDVNVAGLRNGEMELEIKGENFPQSAKKLPYEDLEFSRTTWGQWKLDFPDSHVFIGMPSHEQAEHANN